MPLETEPNPSFVRPAKAPEENPLAQLPELYQAALDEFSRKSFDEASLNDIIRAAGLNKGRFYYRFKDKMDLYLCLLDQIGRDKLAYFAQRSLQADFPSDFFQQLSLLARAGLEYARHEPRYLELWRRHLAETAQVKQQVRQAFPELRRDGLRNLVEAASQRGQFRGQFAVDFVFNLVEMLLNNIDALIEPAMDETAVLAQLDNLMQLLRSGLAAGEGADLG